MVISDYSDVDYSDSYISITGGSLLIDVDYSEYSYE